MSKTPTTPSARLRRRSLWFSLGAVIVAVALPILAQASNALTVAGFPLGFYLAAQGAPVMLALLMVFFARGADRIEIGGEPESEDRHGGA